MKRIFRNILPAVVAALSLVACEEDLGTSVGGDGKPAVTLYTYEVSAPYNADNDIQVRAVGNNKVDEIYFLAVKNDEVASLSDDELTARVLEQGTKVDTELDTLAGSPIYDDVVTDLYGLYTLAVVGRSGSKTALATTTFLGLDWEDVTTGTYYFANTNFVAPSYGAAAAPTTLQVCTTDASLYRFKDVYGPGFSLRIQLLSLKGQDDDGVYTFFRVPVQNTGLAYGPYTIGVRDIGYWQGNDAFVTDGGYESGLYEDNSAFIFVQYFARELTSGNNMGYDYDFFIPD